MKKAILVGMLAVAVTGCSSMKEIQVRDTRANPDWYVDCKQIGAEGWKFWNRDKFAYACGMGESLYEQAAEAQAYAFAVKGFAERINGTVNSSTVVDIKDDKRTTQTRVEHAVTNTVIREHLEVKKYSYQLSATGKVHTYVRIKMPLETFDKLIAEAKAR
jgi:hypothetical protein